MSPEQRLEVLGAFDRLWRAKREIELFHLADDALLSAAEKLSLVDSELAGLILFDATRKSAKDVTTRTHELLQERRVRISDFMHNARWTLGVPPVSKARGHAGWQRIFNRINESGNQGYLSPRRPHLAPG